MTKPSRGRNEAAQHHGVHVVWLIYTEPGVGVPNPPTLVCREGLKIVDVICTRIAPWNLIPGVQ